MSMQFHIRKDNKIIKIDNLYIITSGTPSELETIENPNQVGEVVDKAGVFLSDITPIIIIINKNRKNLKECLDILNKIGGDFNKKINYYGTPRSANDILKVNNPDLHYSNIGSH